MATFVFFIIITIDVFISDVEIKPLHPYYFATALALTIVADITTAIRKAK